MSNANLYITELSNIVKSGQWGWQQLIGRVFFLLSPSDNNRDNVIIYWGFDKVSSVVALREEIPVILDHVKSIWLGEITFILDFTSITGLPEAGFSSLREVRAIFANPRIVQIVMVQGKSYMTKAVSQQAYAMLASPKVRRTDLNYNSRLQDLYNALGLVIRDS